MVEKTVELTGISATSIEEAVALAVSRASVTLSGIHSARVTDIAAEVEDKHIARWRVTVKVTFMVADQLHE